ncbi:class I SAM-dependent methyltransferase [Nocardia sp. 004]|uniref:class I SAM-dependent methyltransferase n=1 Tax=Nocardia sp. 004 TaxID=3385978 RepID=UPI0039A15A05
MRTDDDSWDIVTSVGSTALFVAAARALEAQKPEPLAVDPYAELFCRAVGGRWADLLDDRAPDHKLQATFGSYFVSFQGARTRYFDNYFRVAADSGARQVVILAAGLDSRAYRLAWPDGTVVYELDKPQVLEFKRMTLAGQGATPTADRREIAVDLRDDWPRALRDNGFDPARPSVWLAEGLMLYLPAAAQERVFTGIDMLACSGSHTAIEDAMPIDEKVFRECLEAERASEVNEVFFQLIYNERCAPADEWFTAHGWKATGIRLTEYLSAVGHPIDPSTPEAGPMIGAISLVSAVKR